MTDRLAELGALQYAVENLSTAGTSPNRLALAGYIHAAYTDYQAWAAANPGVNPNRLSAKGRIYGYFYDHASWSPSSLFAASEVGAWYDPSDLTTMFQDRAGTTPVTADGQPVGLILDKSKGLALGSELVTNGGFSGVVDGTDVTTLTGWSVYGSPTYRDIQGEKLRIVSTGSGQGAVLSVSTVAGKYYNIRFDASGSISGTSGIYCPDASNITFDSGSLDAKIKASGTTMLFYFRTGNDNAGTVYFDNISVKELSGNHAVAPSDAARPLKASTGAADWTNYDAVDDVLNTTFPSSLGSSCTVCRANVGGAPTILTGQTIGTSYADSTDNAGLIIINRALTLQETTDVTAWLTAKGAT